MLLTDEQYVIKWLSQYGPLPKAQVVRLLKDKSPATAERLLLRMKRDQRIADVGDGYYLGLDPYGTPDQRVILAVWVLLQFIRPGESPWPTTPPPTPASCILPQGEHRLRDCGPLRRGAAPGKAAPPPGGSEVHLCGAQPPDGAAAWSSPRRPACSPPWSSKGRKEPQVHFFRGGGERRCYRLAFKPPCWPWRASSASIQTLDRTVRQAAALEEENRGLLARQRSWRTPASRRRSWPESLPACTGRPHVFCDGGPERQKSPRRWRWASPREGWFSLRMPMLLPKKGVVAPPPMCGCSCCRRCAGSSRGSRPCGSAPACWCSATSMPGTAPTGLFGTTTTSRPTWPPTAWPSTSWRTTTPPHAATMNAPPKGTGSAPKSMWCPKRSSPSGCCRKNPCRKRGWSF